MKKKVLFVCLGNTCRSPIAEAVFQNLVNVKGLSNQWVVDSAAIASWHVGEPPNARSIQTLHNHNIAYNGRARQVDKRDFNEFDFIFAMDEENKSDLKNRAPKNCKAKILLIGDFDPQGDRIIRDPYCDDGTEGFEKCYQQCLRASEAIIKHL